MSFGPPMNHATGTLSSCSRYRLSSWKMAMLNIMTRLTLGLWYAVDIASRPPQLPRLATSFAPEAEFPPVSRSDDIVLVNVAVLARTAVERKVDLDRRISQLRDMAGIDVTKMYPVGPADKAMTEIARSALMSRSRVSLTSQERKLLGSLCEKLLLDFESDPGVLELVE